MANGDRPALPPGYVLWSASGSASLAVPLKCVAEELAARSRRAAQAAAQTDAEVAASITPEGAKPAPGERDGPRPPAPRPIPKRAPPGWYRVLPDFEALVKRDSDEGRKAASHDRDVQARTALLLKRLIEAGPDRRVAQPPAWRAALHDLECALPNFAGPVRVIGNALALAEATRRPVRIPPMLLLGPPGVGKTYFSHCVAQLLGAPHASIAFDQPSAGSQLRGSDKYWSNTECGLLFNLICGGTHANPVVLLDEIDKSGISGGSRQVDPLAQLHSALEPQTARRTMDISIEVEFDASLVTYVATANSLRGIGMPLLSRFEVFDIGPPDVDQAVQVARRVIRDVLERLRLQSVVRFERRCAYVLARMSPRLMRRAVEGLVASAASEHRAVVSEEDVWRALGMGGGSRLH
jgi:ATP-dependent Lon protease